MGEALRHGFAAPNDTMITGDIPLLLTLLSQVPATVLRDTPPRTGPAAPRR